MTVSDYLGLWLDTYVRPFCAANTAESYQGALAHLSGEVLALDLSAVQPITLQRDINRLAANYSRQAQILYVALHAAFRRAVELDLVSRNPLDKCDKPRHQRREIAYFTPEEAAAYMRAARSDRAYIPLALMLCMGLRRNEARAVRGCDIVGGVLLVRNQRIGATLAPLKTAASVRQLPVPEGLLPDRLPDGLLYDLSETALRHAHMRVMANAGLSRPVTLHGLRHTCATLAVATGQPLTTVQRLLGHAKFAITADYYVHTDLSGLSLALSGVFSVVA